VESNLTFDGTSLVLAGNYYVNSATQTGLTSTTTVQSLSITGMPVAAAFFDYFVSSPSNGACRAGVVMAVWDNNFFNVSYTDTSTNDYGFTSGIEFLVTLSGSNIVLNAIITSGTWTVKVGTRII
jgi:hypothetical protein